MPENNLFAEITIKFKTCDLIQQKELDVHFGGDFDFFIKELIKEEGIFGIVEDEFEIFSIIKKER